MATNGAPDLDTEYILVKILHHTIFEGYKLVVDFHSEEDRTSEERIVSNLCSIIDHLEGFYETHMEHTIQTVNVKRLPVSYVLYHIYDIMLTDDDDDEKTTLDLILCLDMFCKTIKKYWNGVSPRKLKSTFFEAWEYVVETFDEHFLPIIHKNGGWNVFAGDLERMNARYTIFT